MIKALLTSDLHLGRRSTRIPAEFETARFSCLDCWDRIVRLAVSENVDLVVLSGDLVDRENTFLSSFGRLEAGLQRLGEAGIAVYAVSGNHDYNLIDRFSELTELGHFHPVGRHGKWEHSVFRKGEEALNIVGWSYPEERWDGNPLESLNYTAGNAFPSLGILHSDVENSSPYTPTTPASFQRHAVELWVCGHIHEPRPEYRRFPGHGPVVLVPGSPQALDPGETGPHGVWLAEFHPGRRAELQHVPLSTMRYERLEVDVSGMDESSAQTAVIKALHGRFDAVLAKTTQAVGSRAGKVPELVSFRVRVTGRSPAHGELPASLNELAHGFHRTRQASKAVVERISFEGKPEIDLQELADSSGPPGVLARLLLKLQKGELDASERRLLSDALDHVDALYNNGVFSQLVEAPLGEAHIRDMLADRASLLLDALLQQKEEA
jgi:DNA repair exonuclease SbcCD nuclease subunit